MVPSPSIAVAGGGAAGFFAAITAAEAGARVTLLESGTHLLAKVRISGGGRCNVTHACFDPKELAAHYPRGHRELLGPFHHFQPRDTIAWFARRGVALKTEGDGRMFPVTDRSETIVECLQRAAAAAGVTVRTRTGLQGAERVADRFRLSLAGGETLVADKLILATGGNPQSRGFALAQALGHTVTPLVPSLFTFHITDPRFEGLAGLSVDPVEASVPKARLVERGPLLVTHWGASGPVILRLSAWGARALHELNYRFTLRIRWVVTDVASPISDQLDAAKRAEAKRKVSGRSPFPLPARLWERLVAAAGIEPDRKWADLTRLQLQALGREITAGEFEVTGKSPFKEEFVTCGGVRLREVDFRTLESRVCPGLHFAGEMLDIDGITGGFNFQAAWTTGFLAGRAAAAHAAAPPGKR